MMMEMLELDASRPYLVSDVLSKAKGIATALENMPDGKALITDIVARIILDEGALKILLDRHALSVRLIGPRTLRYNSRKPIFSLARGKSLQGWGTACVKTAD